MERVETYRQIVLEIFNEYAQIPHAYGEVKDEIIVDHEADKYLLMMTGWQDDKRIHVCLVHIDIINGKVWIQRDGTEHGIASDLERYGIPKDHIVLGFRQPDLRQYTDYAVD